MKVIIVDDEPKAIELIRSYLSYFSDFELVQTFRNGLKALEFMNSNAVDVIFLDINMPHLSGLSLSKMIAKETAIVFTTAYSEHAVESYALDAVDYLLKPISLERFSKTIIKIAQRFNQDNTSTNGKDMPKVVFIKSGKEIHRLKINDIYYLKKDGNYMHYITRTKAIMARETVAEALQHLTEDFIQVQKSYIVNFNNIEYINPDFITIGEVEVPIGAQYRKALNSRIN